MYKITNGLPPEIMNEIFQGRQESHDSLSYTSQFTVATIVGNELAMEQNLCHI